MANLPLNFGLICGGFFLLLTLAAGIGLLVYSLNSKKKAGASQNWPAAPGTIIISEVRQGSTSDEDGNIKVHYYPHIEYTYFAGGQSNTSKQVSFGGVRGYNTAAQVEGSVNKYPVNSSVMVYYNPANPHEAVLEKAAGSGSKTALTMAIILLVISVLIACPLLIGLVRN